MRSLTSFNFGHSTVWQGTGIQCMSTCLRKELPSRPTTYSRGLLITGLCPPKAFSSLLVPGSLSPSVLYSIVGIRDSGYDKPSPICVAGLGFSQSWLFYRYNDSRELPVHLLMDLAVKVRLALHHL